MQQIESKKTAGAKAINIVDVGQINAQVNETAQDFGAQVRKEHEQKHINSGEYLKSAVYGGIDGTINIMAVILAGIGSNTTAYHVLSVCISVLIGDGFSMGLGDYLSVKAEKQFIASEEQREREEVETKPQMEKQEVIQIYEAKGYSVDDATRLTHLFASNDQVFVNIMMLEQLGLVVNDSSPIRCGITTFVAFLVCGVLPLIPYIISAGILGSQDHQLIACIVIAIVQLFSLGLGKALLLDMNVFKSGFEILILGSLAIAIGYGIGVALSA